MLFAVVAVSFLAGIFAILFLQWIIIQKFVFGFEPTKCEIPKPKIRRCVLPEELKEMIQAGDFRSETESWLSINLIMQFLFKEWKDASVMRKFITKKISTEFEEFLQNTTTGKFIEYINIKDLSLGNKSPLLRDIKILNIVLHPVHGHIKELDIQMHVDYSGGCELLIEAETVLGKSAQLAIKVTKLEGLGRLQFTQDPYSHWSFAFLEPPVTQFEVKSQLLPQITSLIISQIRRVLKKRHTLPQYKIRYKPFCLDPHIRQPNANKCDDLRINGSKFSNGYLCVNVVECSRLVETPSNTMLYCTLAIDSSAWVEISSSQSSSWVTQDVEISKEPNQTVGIVLKQEFIMDKYDYFVVVEMIAPNSPASTVDIKRNDVLVAIGGIRVTTVTHAVKLFKQAGDKFIIRVERKSNLRCSQSQEFLNKDMKINEEMLSLKDDDVSQDEDMEDFISYTIKDVSDVPKKLPVPLHKQLFYKKHDEALSSPKLSKKKFEEDSTKKKTDDTNSSKSVTSRVRSHSEGPHFSSSADNESVCSGGTESDRSNECGFVGADIDLKKTTQLKSSTDPIWEEKFEFLVTDTHHYLNLGIWCKLKERKQERLMSRLERDTLLGYTSICLSDIALECATTSSGSYQQNFSLMPPEPKTTISRDHKLASHSGFNQKLCHGDVTLMFVHRPEDAGWEVVDSEDDNEDVIAKKRDEVESTARNELKQSHDFIEAHFNSATICHFCHKKIWLKTAYQCRNCAMICHKKCVSKCQTHTICLQSTTTVDGPTQTDSSEPSSTQNFPHIVTTVIDSGDISFDTIYVTTPTPESQTINVFESSIKTENQPKRKRSLSSLFSNLASQSKQSSLSHELLTASSNSLAPPTVNSHASSSKSLPGSPHHSPRSSRKCSLQENPFTIIHNDEDIDAAIERVLLHHPQDEMLISSAKKFGKELYVNLPFGQRKIKLNLMIAKLQSEISSEDKRRADLRQEASECTDLAAKTKLTFLINKSDEKIQALAVLMLHYFAGLQHCNESEQSEDQDQDEVDQLTSRDSLPGSLDVTSTFEGSQLSEVKSKNDTRPKSFSNLPS